jgi:hypothetical protein
MKWDNICPICEKEFELNDDIECEDSTLYHVQCLLRKERNVEEECDNKLREVILNFDDMAEFVEFNIDLEILAGYVDAIESYMYFITVTAEGGGFGCFYSDDETLEPFTEFLDTQRQEGEYVYVTCVIKNRKFVKWEEIPRSIKVVED